MPFVCVTCDLPSRHQRVPAARGAGGLTDNGVEVTGRVGQVGTGTVASDH